MDLSRFLLARLGVPAVAAGMALGGKVAMEEGHSNRGNPMCHQICKAILMDGTSQTACRTDDSRQSRSVGMPQEKGIPLPSIVCNRQRLGAAVGG